MKILQHLLLLTASITTAAFTISCNGKTKDPVTLTVLNYLDSTDPNSANDIANIWDKFEKNNPYIKIVREDYFSDEFHAKTEEYFKTNTLPDVINMWPGGRSAFIHEAHAVKDLRPFLKKNGLTGFYSPASLNNQYAGYLAELPDSITYTNVLFVNKKLLKENGFNLPEKYEDIAAMVPVFEKKGLQVILMDNKPDWVMQSLLFSLVAGRYGGVDWFDRIKTGKDAFTSDWFIKSLALINDMCRNGIINKETLSYEYGKSQVMFAEGKAPFFIGGDWKTASFQTDKTTGLGLISPEAQQNDFELMSMPVLPDEILHDSDSGTTGTGWAINASIPAGSAKEAAAWKLIMFLQGQDVQTYRLTIGKAFPTLKTLNIENIAKQYNLEPFTIKRANIYKTYPVMTPVIDSVLPKEVYTTVNATLQGIIRGIITPEKAAAAIQKSWDTYRSSHS